MQKSRVQLKVACMEKHNILKKFYCVFKGQVIILTSQFGLGGRSFFHLGNYRQRLEDVCPQLSEYSLALSIKVLVMKGLRLSI